MPSPLRVTLRAALIELIAAIDGQPIPSAIGPQNLRRMERRILEAAQLSPIPGKVLIRKAGLAFNSSARAAITQLVRMGELIRTADGYTKKLPPA